MASYGAYDSVAHYRLERDVVQNYLVNLFNMSHPGWNFRLEVRVPQLADYYFVVDDYRNLATTGGFGAQERWRM